MADLITIYNGALLAANVAPLGSVDDPSKARRDCDVHYALERPALLQSYRWPFALRRVVLSPVQQAPAFAYQHAMRLPDDCLHVVGASPDSMDIRELLTPAPTTYRVEGRDLLTDAPALYVLYVADVTNPTEFSPLFVRVLVLRLAARLAVSIANDRQMAAMLLEEGERELGRARRTTSVEQPAEVPDTYGWFDVRGRGGFRGRLGPGHYTPESEPVV